MISELRFTNDRSHLDVQTVQYHPRAIGQQFRYSIEFLDNMVVEHRELHGFLLIREKNSLLRFYDMYRCLVYSVRNGYVYIVRDVLYMSFMFVIDLKFTIIYV